MHACLLMNLNKERVFLFKSNIKLSSQNPSKRGDDNLYEKMQIVYLAIFIF